MVKGGLCSTILDFFVRGTLEAKTAIILIPNKENPKTLKDFRPINLYNITYKLISKILVNLLRLILSRLISPTQGAFVPGKNALDQIVVARELVHAMSKMTGSQPTVAVKLDVEKAYDNLC